MERNVGRGDRWARLLGSLALLSCAVMAPLPLLLRVGIFGVMGGYLLLTSALGRCVGYRLLGRSTCPMQPQR